MAALSPVVLCDAARVFATVAGGLELELEFRGDAVPLAVPLEPGEYVRLELAVEPTLLMVRTGRVEVTNT